MVKLIFSFVIIIASSGCVKQVSDVHPSISKESVYFENRHYSLYYPKGWVVQPYSETNNLFGDWDHRKYHLQIDIFENPMSDGNYLDSGVVEVAQGSLKKAGFTNISYQFKDIIFDSKKAHEYIFIGRKLEDYREYREIFVEIDNKIVGEIFVEYDLNHGGDIRQRMEEILSSIHFK